MCARLSTGIMHTVEKIGVLFKRIKTPKMLKFKDIHACIVMMIRHMSLKKC